MADWLTYQNQGATRNQPINERLVNAMSFLPEMGVTMNVYSGGQDAEGPNRVGSTRHDHGNAADVEFFKDGRKLDWNNPDDIPVLSNIVAQARAAGVTGIGAGDDYMGPGRIHIGFGEPAVWGAGGRSANAPEWLRTAYNASPSTGNAGTQAIAAATQPQATNPGLIPQRPAKFPSFAPQPPPGASPYRAGYGVLPDQIAQRMPPRPVQVAQAPVPPQRPGILGGLLNAGQGVQQTAQNVGGSLQGNPIARAMLNNQVRGFWSNPNMGTAISRDPIQGRQGVAVQTVGQGGGQMAYATPSMRSGSSRSSINSPEAVIRRANSAAIREATGSGAINRNSIADALNRGATLVRRA